MTRTAKKTAAQIYVRRVYDAPSPRDGLRILADRLWPRGLSKEKAAVDRWEKDIAPSNALRRWFNHRPERWDEFCRRYGKELEANREALAGLRALAATQKITLLTATRDMEHTHVLLLKKMLEKA